MNAKQAICVFCGSIMIPAILGSCFIALLIQPKLTPSNQKPVVVEVPPPTVYRSSPSKPSSSGGAHYRRALGLPF